MCAFLSKMNGNLKVAFCLAAILSGAADVAGRNVSLDLRPRNAPRRMSASALSGQDGVTRSFRLDAGAADVGEVTVGDQLTFTLFNDVTLSLTLNEKAQSPFEGDVFLAEVSGYEGMKTAVVLRTAEGLTIDVQDFYNDKVYRVVSGPTGVNVSEIEPSREGKCGCDTVEPPAPSAAPAASFPNAPRTLFSAAEQSDTCVDVLVAYDRNAAAYADKEGGLTNFALVAVQKMNTVLANTGLDEKFRFRLVGVCSLDVAETDVHGAFDALQSDLEGWTKAKEARDAVGADILTMLIDTGSAFGNTGIGMSLTYTGDDCRWFAPNAYNVCAIRSVMQSHTMTHECGHNLGAGHSDRQRTQPGPQSYDYSSGYFFTAGGKAYATVMAYEGENPSGANTAKVPYFSSPNYTYEGVAVGDAMHDNTRVLTSMFPYAAAWKEQRVPMSYDIAFDPPSGATIDGSLAVTLIPGKAGAQMRYTLDGSDPTPDSPLYTGPVTLTGNTLFKAATFVDGQCSIPYEAVYYSKTDFGYALGLPELDWTASGDWRVQTTNTFDGVAVETPDTPGAVASLSANMAGPLTITFNYRQQGIYRAEVLCDGTAVWTSTFRNDGWQTAAAEIPAGVHAVTFRVTTTYGSSQCFFGLDAMRLHDVRAPAFSPATTATASTARIFEGEIPVALSTDEEDASIYYTLDGGDPTGEGALLYEGPFFITDSTRVKAVVSVPGKGESAVVEGVYLERHRPRAGEWTLWGEAAYSEVANSGRLIAELYWDYPGADRSRALGPVITSETFTTWAAANGVYLLAGAWGNQEGASGGKFWSLFNGTALARENNGVASEPTFVFASAANTGAGIGALFAIGGSSVNGRTYQGTPESLIDCFASFLGSAPPSAPVPSVTDATGRSFPFPMTLDNVSGSGTIYYTLDGSAPTRENGTRYTGSLTIPAPGTTLKAAVWPDGGTAVSGIPLVLTYDSLDDVIGLPGITWENDAALPWTVSPSSAGVTLSGGKDSALSDGSTSSTLSATFSKPGTFSFTPALTTCSGSVLALNGILLLRESTNCSVTVEAGTKLVWTYVSKYGDAGSGYGAKLDSLRWEPSGVPDPVSSLTASQGEYEYGTILRWTASPDATSYAVYRSTENDPARATLIGTTEKCQYWDQEGEVGIAYWYWVTAVNGNGENEFQAAVSGWRPVVYTVIYDANGGIGRMDSQFCRDRGTLIVAENAFQFAGRIFAGWATRAGDAVQYKPGDSVTVTSDMTLYAVWDLPPFDFGGDAEWTYLGGGVWRSGSIGDNCQTWIQKTVSGAGKVSFEWSSSSEVNRDELTFFLDGKRRAWISGESAWMAKSFDITGSGTHVLKWVYAKDGSGRAGSDCAWIRNFVCETSGSGSSSRTTGVSALTFNGYALDGDGVVSGTFVLAVKKPKKGASSSAATLTFTSLATGKKTKITGNVNLATGEGSGALAGLKIASKIVGGTVAKAGTLTGGLDAVKAKDSAALSVLAKFNGKGYVVALGPDNPAAYAQGGYSTLSIAMAAKGKAKISGVLADGTKVTATAQMTVDDTGCFVPVVYAKKSKLGFVVRFDRNTRALVEVTALTPWKNTVKPAFTMAWAIAGLGAKSAFPSGSKTLTLDDSKLSGFLPSAIAQTPKEIPFTVKGTKWNAGKAAKVAYKGGTLTVNGANVSGLKLTFTAKTGLFKGSFTVYSLNGGKLKKNKFSVFGAVTDGTGYGTAVLKGKGSLPLSIN